MCNFTYRTCAINLSEACLKVLFEILDLSSTALKIETLEICSETPMHYGFEALEEAARRARTRAGEYGGLAEYRAISEAHDRALETDQDFAMLTAGFAKMENLRAVDIKGGRVHNGTELGSPGYAIMCAWIMEFDQHGLAQGELPMADYEQARSVRTVLMTMGMTGRRLEFFKTRLQDYEAVLSGEAFQLDENAFDGLTSVGNALRVLETQMDFCSGPVSYAGRPLGLFSDLREVCLMFRDEIRVLLAEMRHTGLVRLELYDFKCEENELFSVLQASCRTLKQVCLGAEELRK